LPSSDADGGVSTNLAAIRLTNRREFERQIFRHRWHRGCESRDEHESLRRAAPSRAAHEQQGSSRANLVCRVASDPQRQKQMGLDVAPCLFKIEFRQRCVVGNWASNQHVVVLDAIRDELPKSDYLPVLFDFEKPDSKNLNGTITTLAKMARFIIADLTDPSSVPHELAMIVPTTKVPVQTVLLEGQCEYSMFADLKDCRWVLEPYRELEPPDVLKQSIGMREGQDASRAIFWVGDGLKAKIGELARNFSGTFRGFGFDHESVRARPSP
jgi:hypothetical protein